MKLCGRMTALIMAVLMLLATVGCGADFDYETSDLSEYVDIPASAYKGQKLTIDKIVELDDDYLDEYVRVNLITANGKDVYLTDRETKEGDVVALYYRAFVKNADGSVKELFSNMTDTSPLAYDPAENDLKFGAEFDAKLIGLSDKNKMEQKTTGKVEEGDRVLYASYSYSYLISKEGEAKKYKTVMQETPVRLELDTVDARFGEGFAAQLMGKEIGKQLKSFTATFDANGDGASDEVTFDLKISHVSKENAITFDITYPADYEKEELKGKTVSFVVCVNGILGTARELLDKKFIEETLQYKPDEEDKDKDIVEVFLTDLKESLAEQRESALKASVYGALFEKLQKELTFKSLPEDQVEMLVQAMEDEARAAYQQYNSQVGASSLKAFIHAYYDLETDVDYKEYFRETSETNVKQALIYYTIVRQENIKVTDKEYEEQYDGYMAQMLYNEMYNYYAQTGQYVNITEKDFVRQYGKDYVEASIRQAILQSKLQDFIYEQNTYEMKEPTEEEEKAEAESGAAQ